MTSALQTPRVACATQMQSYPHSLFSNHISKELPLNQFLELGYIASGLVTSA